MNKAVSELKNYSEVSETAMFLEKLKINLHFDSLIFDKLSFDTPSYWSKISDFDSLVLNVYHQQKNVENKSIS